MISADDAHELLDYNYWARDRQLEACARVTGEHFVKPLGNSFSSLRDTLVHLLGVEWVWLERWRGRAVRSFMASAEFPSLGAIADRWHHVEREMRDYLGAITDERLSQPLTYTNMRGKTTTYPLGRTVYHLFNHQTYHRGQVTTLLRQLGATPASVDFVAFLEVRTSM
jgi:uncharacterized damage-inducible protein DinB